MQQSAVIWMALGAAAVGAVGVTLWLFSRQPASVASSLQDSLPSQVIGWQKADQSRIYDPESIFSYIDGHAEVYLAYGMRGCLAERYIGPEGQPDFILDIFEMTSPADAFGVFTHDTEGEDVDIGRGSRYRYGWLSFWQGSSFVSIVTEGETELADRAALELGRQVAALLPAEGEPPAILEALPEADLEPRSIRYLHHPQILNTHLPVDPENLLDLGMDTEAVLGTYRRTSDRAHVLIVDYPDEQRAEVVEKRVLESLSTHTDQDGTAAPGAPFAGCGREGRRLVVVMETPSEDWTQDLLRAAVERGSNP